MKRLTDASIAGVATLTTAALLTKIYNVTDFHPPKPVFWFFIGFSAKILDDSLGQLLLDYLKKRLAEPGLATSQVTLGGLGESLASIDYKIRVYQSNISGLQKILRAGSAKGKVAAKKKLAFIKRNLATLYRMRSRAA